MPFQQPLRRTFLAARGPVFVKGGEFLNVTFENPADSGVFLLLIEEYIYGDRDGTARLYANPTDNLPTAVVASTHRDFSVTEPGLAVVKFAISAAPLGPPATERPYRLPCTAKVKDASIGLPIILSSGTGTNFSWLCSDGNDANVLFAFLYMHR